MELQMREAGPDAKTPLRTVYDEHGDALLEFAALLTRDRRMAEALLAETLRRVPRPVDAPRENRVVLRRRGQRWVVKLGDRVALVQDSVGMTYLAVLLANPGQEIPAVQLAAGHDLAGSSQTEAATGSRQPVLDERAKHAYRERISALQAEIEEHEANHDLARAEQVRAEHDWLITELAAATGLAGRVRTFTGNDERARVSVGKAIRRAIDRTATAEPVIGEALRTTIRTGLRCCYRPD